MLATVGHLLLSIPVDRLTTIDIDESTTLVDDQVWHWVQTQCESRGLSGVHMIDRYHLANNRDMAHDPATALLSPMRSHHLLCNKVPVRRAVPGPGKALHCQCAQSNTTIDQALTVALHNRGCES